MKKVVFFGNYLCFNDNSEYILWWTGRILLVVLRFQSEDLLYIYLPNGKVTLWESEDSSNIYLKQNFGPASFGCHLILKIIVGSLNSNQSNLFDSTSSLLRGFEKHLSDPGLSNQSILYYSNLHYILKAKFPTSIYSLSSNLEKHSRVLNFCL